MEKRRGAYGNRKWGLGWALRMNVMSALGSTTEAVLWGVSGQACMFFFFKQKTAYEV